jgi:hypothetical protein
MPVALHDCKHLVPEHQHGVVGGSDTEQPFGDLAVRAAHTDFEHAQEHPVARRLRCLGHAS